MSKLWLLLLLVAAAQVAHGFPKPEEDEYEIDEVDEIGDVETRGIDKSVLDIIKDAWGQIKEKNKESLQKFIDGMKAKYCPEVDVNAEDTPSVENDEEKTDVQNSQDKIAQKMKELIGEIKNAIGEKKEELKQKFENLKSNLCKAARAIDVEGGDSDEDRINWSKLGQKIAKGLKKIGNQAKKLMKKGAKMLKENGVKVTPVQCHEKSCQSCIRFLTEFLCVKMTVKRTNKATRLTIALTYNDNPLTEEHIKLGDVPRCVDIGGSVGRLCLKGIEGKGKSSQGQAKANFCLGILLEQYGFGCKLCASYKDKKLKMRVAPKLFPAGRDESGNIVTFDDKEENGVELDADEFELDE